MPRCTAIKPNGERCKGTSIGGSEWCWNHDPEHAAAQRRAGSKGGKRDGRGRPSAELGALRVENADIRKRLLEGKLKPGVAAIAIQSLNTDIRAVDVSMKAKEQEELIARIEEVDGAMEGEGRRYGT